MAIIPFDTDQRLRRTLLAVDVATVTRSQGRRGDACVFDATAAGEVPALRRFLQFLLGLTCERSEQEALGGRPEECFGNDPRDAKRIFRHRKDLSDVDRSAHRSKL